MAQSNVPVMEAARAAYRFWREAWRPALGALLVLAAATAVQYFFATTGRTGLSFAAMPLAVLAQVVAYGALFRLAFADERTGEPAFQTGPGGLQWGGMETRLLLAWLLLALLVFVALILFLFVFVVAIMAVAGGAAANLEGADTPQEVAEAIGPAGLLTLSVVAMAAAALAIWASVRLVLVAPATAASGKVQVFETWALTKGQFWRIFAAVLIASAPTIVWMFFSGAVNSTFGEKGEREGETVLPETVALIMAVLAGFVGGVLQAPLTAGLGAYLYRGLRRPPGATA